MITITVKNAPALVRRERGALLGALAPLLVDVQLEVEKKVALRIAQALEAEGVEADIEVSPGER